MVAINRAALKEQLWPGIVEIFGTSYEDHPTEYTDIFDTRKSSKAYEEYVMESMFGLAPGKAEGAPTAFDEAGDVWKGRVAMEAYALGFVITREAVEDNQYFDMVPKYTRALKRSMRITKEVRAAAFLDASFSTSKTGDGVAIISASHPLKSGGTFSTIANANADLNETSLEAAIIQMGDYVDERGLPIAVKPRSLIIPNGLQFTADRLMNTTRGQVGTDLNTKASAAPSMVPEGTKLNHYLSDPDAWWLKSDISEGMTYWERTPLSLEDGDGTETQTMKVMAYERYAFSCMDPRSLFGSPGS